MPNDTNTDNDTIRSSDDTIRSQECEHKLTSPLAKILAVLPDRLISRGVEGVIAALHEVRLIERHCRTHPTAASVQAVELLDNEHRLDTIVQRYLNELTRAAAKAEEAKANAEKHRTLANEAWAQRDTAERDLDAAKSMCAKLSTSNLRGTLLESLGLDEATIEAAAKLAAGTPVPSSHVDPTPNSLVVRLAEVLTGCPMSTTELVETRVTRAAASILRWLDDPKVPAVKLSPSLPSIPEDYDGEGLPPLIQREAVTTLLEDLRTDLVEATGSKPDATLKDIIQEVRRLKETVKEKAVRDCGGDLALALECSTTTRWGSLIVEVKDLAKAKMALANARRDLAAELGAGVDEGWEALLARVKDLVKAKDLKPRNGAAIEGLCAQESAQVDEMRAALRQICEGEGRGSGWSPEMALGRVARLQAFAEEMKQQRNASLGRREYPVKRAWYLPPGVIIKREDVEVGSAEEGSEGYETRFTWRGVFGVLEGLTDDETTMEACLQSAWKAWSWYASETPEEAADRLANGEANIHAKLVAIIDPKDERKLSLEGALEVVRVLAQAKPGPGRCFDDYAVAMLLHESGRPAVKDGQSVSGSATFVEWYDLPPVVRAGRLLTARHLMEVVFVGVMPAPAGATVLCKEAVARAIHLAERDTIDRGWVLNPTGKPWIEFDQLSEAARAGRLRQAEAMECAKVALWVWDK